MKFDTYIEGEVRPGYGHASGVRSVKYPEGTINLQRPHFALQGVDISGCFAGTINLSIAPKIFRPKRPEFVLHEIVWKKGRRAENFFIGRCRVSTSGKLIDGYIYAPDPATKVSSFDDPSHLQILAPYIAGVAYGMRLGVHLRSEEFELSSTSGVF